MSDARRPRDQLTDRESGPWPTSTGLSALCPPVHAAGPAHFAAPACLAACAQPPLAPLVATGQALHLPRLVRRMPSAHGACDTLPGILAI